MDDFVERVLENEENKVIIRNSKMSMKGCLSLSEVSQVCSNVGVDLAELDDWKEFRDEVMVKFNMRF